MPKSPNNLMLGLFCANRHCAKHATRVYDAGNDTLLCMCDPCGDMFHRFTGKVGEVISQNWMPPSGWKSLIDNKCVVGATGPNHKEV